MQQKHRLRREAKRSRAEAEAQLAWSPPDRSSLDAVESIYFQPLDGDPTVIMEIRRWYLDGRLADFYMEIRREDWDRGNCIEKIASADCLNHGCIHFHDEIRYPKHGQFEPFQPLRQIEDVDLNYERCIDALIDYADMLLRREEGGRR